MLLEGFLGWLETLGYPQERSLAHPVFWNSLWMPYGPTRSVGLQQNSCEVFGGDGATNSTLFAFTCRPRSWEKRRKTKAKPVQRKSKAKEQKLLRGTVQTGPQGRRGQLQLLLPLLPCPPCSARCSLSRRALYNTPRCCSLSQGLSH